MIQKCDNSDNTNKNTKKNAGNSAAETLPCPICEKPVPADATSFPFCGKRCRQIDLGKWLNGSYVISRPVEQRDLEEGVD